MMRFVIQRDGTLADVAVEKSSGNQSLDFLATRALRLSQLPPLPAAYHRACADGAPRVRLHALGTDER